MRTSKYFISGIWMLIPALALAEIPELGGFESWEDSQKKSVIGSPASRLEVSESSVTEESEPVTEDYVIHFGAGASWVVPLRLADNATTDKVLSVFSASWAPFGLVGELGFDMAMARDSSFIATPNLKFFFAKYSSFSFYLEGALAIHSHQAGVDLGGGGGLGMIFGIADHLALEIRASAVVLDLSGGVAMEMFGESDDPLAQVSNLVVCPSVGARLMARF
jgi:hypothetical protein